MDIKLETRQRTISAIAGNKQNVNPLLLSSRIVLRRQHRHCNDECGGFHISSGSCCHSQPALTIPMIWMRRPELGNNQDTCLEASVFCRSKSILLWMWIQRLLAMDPAEITAALFDRTGLGSNSKAARKSVPLGPYFISDTLSCPSLDRVDIFLGPHECVMLLLAATHHECVMLCFTTPALVRCPGSWPPEGRLPRGSSHWLITMPFNGPERLPFQWDAAQSRSTGTRNWCKPYGNYSGNYM